MIWKCPACEKDKITYWNKLKMFGVYKTVCPHCGSRLGTTPKWSVLSIFPVTVICLMIAVLILKDMLGYAWLMILVYTIYKAIVVWYKPLIVKEFKRAPDDRDHIEI